MQKKKKYFYISIIKGREGTVERTWAWQEIIEKEKENLEQKNQELQECWLRKNIPKKMLQGFQNNGDRTDGGGAQGENA